MSVSDKVKGLLALRGVKQLDLAAEFGMSKQTMSNKFARNSWSANDLAKAAEFCGCNLAIVGNNQRPYGHTKLTCSGGSDP